MAPFVSGPTTGPIRPSGKDPGSALRLFVLLAAVAALALVVGARVTDAPDAPGPGEGLGEGAAGTTAGSADRRRPAPTVVPASEACPRAGYLCSALEEGREVHIARWNSDTGRLRIRVPPPPGADPARAREVQEAVANGIRAWHRRPFDIRVDLSERPGDHDFVVSWAHTLGGLELGRTRTRWVSADGRADLEVREFVLATRNPRDPARDLPARQIELTAAHEMGHALGLPHSDEPRDVMYPENTATRLTSRDFMTMSALYELENGAVVR